MNLGKGLASEEARNYYAGLCGYDFYIAYFGSKGACLAHFRSVSNP